MDSVRRVAVLGGNRIPFARSDGPYATASNQEMLTAALVTASMDPLALWLAYLLGDPVVSLPQAVVRAIPNYVCAAVAVLPSHVLYRLGRRLREAQALGSYELVELLGHGGMGEVWRARHQLLAREAAIKLVRPEVLGAHTEAEARVVQRRFEREAKATASLSSPHTIQVFDFGMTHDGAFYYVMELLDGQSLEARLALYGNENYGCEAGEDCSDPTKSVQWTIVKATAPWDIWAALFVAISAILEKVRLRAPVEALAAHVRATFLDPYVHFAVGRDGVVRFTAGAGQPRAAGCAGRSAHPPSSAARP